MLALRIAKTTEGPLCRRKAPGNIMPRTALIDVSLMPVLGLWLAAINLLFSRHYAPSENVPGLIENVFERTMFRTVPTRNIVESTVEQLYGGCHIDISNEPLISRLLEQNLCRSFMALHQGSSRFDTNNDVKVRDDHPACRCQHS